MKVCSSDTFASSSSSKKKLEIDLRGEMGFDLWSVKRRWGGMETSLWSVKRRWEE